MKIKNLRISEYDYELPEDRIAEFPLPDRAGAKMLVYRDGNTEDHHFREIPDLLPRDHLLVLNQTKVVRARLIFYKPTGARIEIFCLEPRDPMEIETAMQSRESVLYACMIGNARKWKSGLLKGSFKLGGKMHEISAELCGREEDDFLVRFRWQGDLSFAGVLEACGRMPLPPYIKRDSREEDNYRYQTVYARQEGSVAAPTAGLHFTEEVLDDLRKRGQATASLTLHVGAGTFQPVSREEVKEHHMHGEHFTVDKDLLQTLLKYENRIIATGTTSLRALESIYWLGVIALEGKLHIDGARVPQWLPYETGNEPQKSRPLEALLEFMNQNGISELNANTRLMILPGYTFKMCRALITNFHQPRSTLLLLVSAFTGEDWRKIYKHAMENNYRFLSYGDSSLLFTSH